jgi:hypothetical protein
MEETTTDAASQDTGVEETTQPDETQAEAVTTADSEPTQPEQEETVEDEPAEADTPDDDEDLSDYWAKKGIDISTPEGQAKAAKSYREAEKAMHSKSQEASNLKKSLGDQPATNEDERIRKLELGLAVNDWKSEKGITKAQDDAMGEYLVSNPQKNMALQYGILTLDDIYAMSGAYKVGQADPATIKSQGKTEALRQLANKQQAVSPKGSASKPSGNDIKSLEEKLADYKF